MKLVSTDSLTQEERRTLAAAVDQVERLAGALSGALRASECFKAAARHSTSRELRPGQHERVYFAGHYSLEGTNHA